MLERKNKNLEKVLFILVGPKGSGKTFIGKIIEEYTNIKFLRVEPIWVDYLKEKNIKNEGWQLVNQAIDNEFNDNNKVMIESLGLGEPFHKTIEHFKNI